MTAPAFPNALRCHARSKRTGQQCGAPAVTGWRVCRHHGAGGGAPEGKRHGSYSHGGYTKTATEERRTLRALLREARGQMQLVSPWNEKKS